MSVCPSRCTLSGDDKQQTPRQSASDEVPLSSAGPPPSTIFVACSTSGNFRCHALAKGRSEGISGTLDVRIAPIVASAGRVRIEGASGAVLRVLKSCRPTIWADLSRLISRRYHDWMAGDESLAGARKKKPCALPEPVSKPIRSAGQTTCRGSLASPHSTTGFSSTCNQSCQWSSSMPLEASRAAWLGREPPRSGDALLGKAVLLPPRLMGNPNEVAVQASGMVARAASCRPQKHVSSSVPPARNAAI